MSVNLSTRDKLRFRTAAYGAVTLLSAAGAGLRKAYKDKSVLDGIDFDVRAGTVFPLLGPNGAGKTTTAANRYDPSAGIR